MSRCDFAGAGALLAIWAVAIATGGLDGWVGDQGSGFVILIAGLVGVWAGYAVRARCKVRSAS